MVAGVGFLAVRVGAGTERAHALVLGGAGSREVLASGMGVVFGGWGAPRGTGA
jgi:hypothetical protein